MSETTDNCKAGGRCAPAPGSATCSWTENEGGCHDTQCGHAFEFTNDGVKENDFKFCPFCGKEIIASRLNTCGQCGKKIIYSTVRLCDDCYNYASSPNSEVSDSRRQKP
jgi:hypothetical protein